MIGIGIFYDRGHNFQADINITIASPLVEMAGNNIVAINMLIDPQILIDAGAVFRRHQKGQVIFHEGGRPQYYYQIVSGSVTMVNTRADGSEFIQGIHNEGEAFGAPAVMLAEPFPATAVAAKDVTLIRLARQSFIQMLRQRPDVLLEFSLMLCRRLYYKALIGKCIAGQGPEDRIRTLLQVLKKESGCGDVERYRLHLSRQQIADMVGLRVETVIRSMKKLEEKGLVSIEHGKVYY